MADFIPSCPISLTNNAAKHAQASASIARGAMESGDTFRAVTWQLQAADWAATARFNRLLALHDDVDAAEAAFDACDDESPNDDGKAHAVAFAARRSRVTGCDAQWWLDLIDDTDTPERAGFYRSVAHRLLSNA